MSFGLSWKDKGSMIGYVEPLKISGGNFLLGLMSRDMRKGGKPDKGFDLAEKVVVAVKAPKEIPNTALVCARTHVVQPGDCITLMVVSSQNSGRKLWGFSRFAGDFASGHRRSQSVTMASKDSCSQMNKINVKIKIVSWLPCEAVTAEAMRTWANCVVLDRRLKHEEKCCMQGRVLMQHCSCEAVSTKSCV
ncbi:Protein kinase protein with adenine nucleotide alpha hydrolase-like domain [Forsythia ovata]|uniref:Protein kinase protein with adenine nucleotide alpha hydrolase-like domain n=1 Tax=Forsythia ovata TaxID=205694 RepID=A0ABD1PFC9_9LAMI